MLTRAIYISCIVGHIAVSNLQSVSMVNRPRQYVPHTSLHHAGSRGLLSNLCWPGRPQPPPNPAPSLLLSKKYPNDPVTPQVRPFSNQNGTLVASCGPDLG